MRTDKNTWEYTSKHTNSNLYHSLWALLFASCLATELVNIVTYTERYVCIKEMARLCIIILFKGFLGDHSGCIIYTYILYNVHARYIYIYILYKAADINLHERPVGVATGHILLLDLNNTELA